MEKKITIFKINSWSSKIEAKTYFRAKGNRLYYWNSWRKKESWDIRDDKCFDSKDEALAAIKLRYEKEISQQEESLNEMKAEYKILFP